MNPYIFLTCRIFSFYQESAVNRIVQSFIKYTEPKHLKIIEHDVNLQQYAETATFSLSELHAWAEPLFSFSFDYHLPHQNSFVNN